MFTKTLFFVFDFSVFLISLGVAFSGAGALLGGEFAVINKIAGMIVVVMGLNFIFDFWKTLSIERRFHITKRPRGIVGSVLLGLAFGAGWTPCIGSILASILFLAGTSTNVFRGTALLAVYSLGLGIPFIATGLFFSKFQRQMTRFKFHLRIVKIMSGVFLVILGVLIFAGSLSRMNVFLFSLASRLDAWNNVNPTGSQMLFGFLFLVISLILMFLYGKGVLKRINASRLSFKCFILPGRLILYTLFASSAILSFVGSLSVPDTIIRWLTFQGI